MARAGPGSLCPPSPSSGVDSAASYTKRSISFMRKVSGGGAGGAGGTGEAGVPCSSPDPELAPSRPALLSQTPQRCSLSPCALPLHPPAGASLPTGLPPLLGSQKLLSHPHLGSTPSLRSRAPLHSTFDAPWTL